MLIGELAQAAQVSRDTIRFYEKQGLITGFRLGNGYKNYTPATLDTVNFIKLAQELGFSLREIASILPMLASGQLAPVLVENFVADKVRLIDQRINSLQQLRQRLSTLPIGTDCPLRRDCTPDD
ncbi:MAG: MerR family transcriptional regulator [Agitococcus sp.]